MCHASHMSHDIVTVMVTWSYSHKKYGKRSKNNDVI